MNVGRILPFVLAMVITAGAQQAHPVANKTAGSEKHPTPEWVQRSNQNAQILLKVIADFGPEFGSMMGVPGVDDRVIDLKPQREERVRAAMRDAVAQFQAKLAQEKDPAIRQDLEIMIKTANDQIRESELEEKYFIPYFGLTELVFQGVKPLLDEQSPPERRQRALVRLRRYAGMEPGYEPVATLMEARQREALAKPGIMGPYKGELQKDLGNNPTYIEGVAKLFQKFNIAGYEPVYDKLKQQLAAYDDFLRKKVVPKARTDFRLPEELYRARLQMNGVEIPAEQLRATAHATYGEIQSEMMALAPVVAKQKGIKAADYRDVIREMKKDQWLGESILPNYEKRIADVEEIIRRANLVTLPQRPMQIKLASAAESAATPAPNMQPPRLIGNTGEHGVFVLPLVIPPPPGTDPKQTMRMDDDTYAAASWTLVAHEGRPGHELQFDSMVETGISIPRAVFSFNSTNVEGWALYSESIVKPSMPLDGQLVSLQNRLLRAARAFLDPELQLGLTTPEKAKQLLMEDVVLSDAFSQQEIERYMFWAPGQAPTYFYGYTQLMRLRSDTEKAMGDRFDQRKFHDFILSQGIVPPPLMRKAVFEQFVGAPAAASQAK